MRLNEWGRIVRETWVALPSHYPHIALDAFVIMPDHVHGIIIIGGTGTVGSVGADLRPAPTEVPATRHGLPEIVRAFKSFSARRINEVRITPGVSVWQRKYYEHVVRDEADLARIRAYIQDNPAGWALEHLYPKPARDVDDAETDAVE